MWMSHIICTHKRGWWGMLGLEHHMKTINRMPCIKKLKLTHMHMQAQIITHSQAHVETLFMVLEHIGNHSF